MRFPVFARGSKPSAARPILRKSKSYVEDQVASGRADWIDPLDHRKGIVCREVLYFGERALPPEEITGASASGLELPGLRFEPPASASVSTMPRTRLLPRYHEIYGDWQLLKSLGRETEAMELQGA